MKNPGLSFGARVWGVVGKSQGIIVVAFITLNRGVSTRVVRPIPIIIVWIVVERWPFGAVAAMGTLAYYMRQRRVAVVGRGVRPVHSAEIEITVYGMRKLLDSGKLIGTGLMLEGVWSRSTARSNRVWSIMTCRVLISRLLVHWCIYQSKTCPVRLAPGAVPGPCYAVGSRNPFRVLGVVLLIQIQVVHFERCIRACRYRIRQLRVTGDVGDGWCAFHCLIVLLFFELFGGPGMVQMILSSWVASSTGALGKMALQDVAARKRIGTETARVRSRASICFLLS